MRLREVLRAVSGFKYEIREYDIFPNGKISQRDIFVSIDDTGMRCLQHDLWHEKLIKGQWFVLSENEFKNDLQTYRPKTVLRRRDSNVNEPSKQLSVLDLMIPTKHFMERANQRFGVTQENVKSFLKEVLNDHFIVQNHEFYNGSYRDHNPDNVIVCSRDFKKVLVLAYERSRYVLVTCYKPIDSEYDHFTDWFQDNMEVIHKLPTLQDYFQRRK